MSRRFNTQLGSVARFWPVVTFLLLIPHNVFGQSPPTVQLINQDFFVRAGEEVRFSATITGSGPIAIQWFRHGTPVSGGTFAELVIPHAVESGVVTYQVAASNEFGQTVSEGRVELTVSPAVVFTDNPQSLEVRAGESFSLQARADGIGVVVHWLRGEVMIPAESDGSLLVESASFTDSGIYQAVGVGTYGEGRSDRVRVEVVPSRDPGVSQFVAEKGLVFERNGGDYHAGLPLPDGSFVLAGNFTRINGHDTIGLAKFESNGSVSSEFSSNIRFDGTVHAMVQDASGGILVGGEFNASTSTGIHRGLLRVHADGGIDEHFSVPQLRDHWVTAMANSASGKIYLSARKLGEDIMREEEDKQAIVYRLESNFSIDDTFNQASSISESIDFLAMAQSGNVVVASKNGFTPRVWILSPAGSLVRELDITALVSLGSLGTDTLDRIYLHGSIRGSSAMGWRRFSPTGEPDTDFGGSGLYPITAGAAVIPGGGMYVASSLTLEKIDASGQLVGSNSPDQLSVRARVYIDASGRPLTVRSDWSLGEPRNSLQRFEGDLSTAEKLDDSSFDRGVVNHISRRTDGRFFVAGDFVQVDGKPRDYVALVKGDGTLDSQSLTNTVNGFVREAAVDASGNLFLRGAFFQSFGTDARGFTKIRSDGSHDSAFGADFYWQDFNRMQEHDGLLVSSSGRILTSGFLRLPGDSFSREGLYRFFHDGTLDSDFQSNLSLWAANNLRATDFIELLNGMLLLETPSGPYPNFLRIFYWIEPDGSQALGDQIVRVYDSVGVRVFTDMEDRVWRFSQHALRRFDWDGASDLSFSSAAAVMPYSPSVAVLPNIMRQANGKMIAMGNMSFRDPGIGQERREFAVRFNEDGSVDESFEIKGLQSGVDFALQLESGEFIMAVDGELRRTIPLQSPEVSLQGPLGVVAGAPVRLVANVSGYADSLQWYRNGTRIAGATSAVLQIAEPDADDTAVYAVVARNERGGAVSQLHELTVLEAQSNAGGVHRAAFPVSREGEETLLQVMARIVFAGNPAEVAWSVLLPEGWALRPDYNDFADSAPPDLVTGLAEWSWRNPTGEQLQIYYDLIPPASAVGRWEFPAVIAVTSNGQVLESLANPDPLVLRIVGRSHHAADTNGDRSIDLSELLRVIELYNTRSGTSRTGRYRLNARSVDGFDVDLEAGAFGEVSVFHSADTDHDATVSLSELLRVIELYNTRSGTSRTGAYRVAEDSVDGFAADAD